MSVSIPVTFISSEYQAVWIFPGPGSVFECIQVWDFQEVLDDSLGDYEDGPLDYTTHDDWIEV